MIRFYVQEQFDRKQVVQVEVEPISLVPACNRLLDPRIAQELENSGLMTAPLAKEWTRIRAAANFLLRSYDPDEGVTTTESIRLPDDAKAQGIVRARDVDAHALACVLAAELPWEESLVGRGYGIEVVENDGTVLAIDAMAAHLDMSQMAPSN